MSTEMAVQIRTEPRSEYMPEEPVPGFVLYIGAGALIAIVSLIIGMYLKRFPPK